LSPKNKGVAERGDSSGSTDSSSREERAQGDRRASSTHRGPGAAGLLRIGEVGNHIVGGKNLDRDGAELSPSSPWAQRLPGIGHVLDESNIFSFDMVNRLRKGRFDFTRSTEMAKCWVRWQQQQKEQLKLGLEVEPFVGCVVDAERPSEGRPPVDFTGKSVLAPLTTVGNLPFRRLCVKLGVDITVGEMAMASSIVEGKQSELALLRRHASEKCYGVQIAGGDVETMTKVAQFIDEEVDCDFVDINCGCPLDEVHRAGRARGSWSEPDRLRASCGACPP